MESGVRGRGEFAGVMAASLQEEGRRKDAPGVNAVLSLVFPFVDTWTLAFSAHEVMVACVQRERAESVVASNADLRRKTSSCYYCAQCMSCVLASLCACGNHHSPGVTDMAARSLVAEEHTGTTHTHT